MLQSGATCLEEVDHLWIHLRSALQRLKQQFCFGADLLYCRHKVLPDQSLRLVIPAWSFFREAPAFLRLIFYRLCVQKQINPYSFPFHGFHLKIDHQLRTLTEPLERGILPELGRGCRTTTPGQASLVRSRCAASPPPPNGPLQHEQQVPGRNLETTHSV